MSGAFRISPDAIWTETDEGEVFAGRAPEGPVLHLAGAGGAIFLAVAEEQPKPVVAAELIDAFLPVAGLPREELAEQITGFVDQLLEQGVLVAA